MGKRQVKKWKNTISLVLSAVRKIKQVNRIKKVLIGVATLDRVAEKASLKRRH